MKRPIQDFEEHLSRQLRFLERSVDAYDEGFTDEYIRIAQTLRVLFHNTRNSHGLWEQMGTQADIIDSSGPFELGNTVANTSLLQTGSGEQSQSMFAPLSSSIRKNSIPVKNWWQQIILVGDRIKYSRRQLVITVANKEGGSHVDPNITEDFSWIEKTGLGLFLLKNSDELHVPDNIVSASIRQIAHEVLETFLDGYNKEPDKSDYIFSMGAVALVLGDKKNKIPRNQQCPCESGLKYKKCHGFI